MTIIIEIIKFITVTLVVYALLSAIAALIKRQRDAKAKATDGIPHVPQPPIPKPQPLKRLPPLVRRAVSIPYSYGGVDVGLLLYYWGADHLLIIGEIDSGDADDNKRRADELVDAINKLLNYTRQ